MAVVTEVSVQGVSGPRLGGLLFFPNLLLIGGVLLVALGAAVHRGRVAPLLTTDDASHQRIAQLERAVLRAPAGPDEAALELARLYAQAGEFPWANDALQKAEVQGGGEIGWRLNLGLAYLSVGRNDQAERVLGDALARCAETTCTTPVTARLAIFKRAAELLTERGINGRKTPELAMRTVQEILKPISVEVPAGEEPRVDAGLNGQ